MFIPKRQERRASLSAILGVILHGLMIWGLSFLYVEKVPVFFPDHLILLSGWEMIFSMFGNIWQSGFLAIIFSPFLLVYLGSMWVFSRFEKKWLAWLSGFAVLSDLLAFFNPSILLLQAIFCPWLFYLVSWWVLSRDKKKWLELLSGLAVLSSILLFAGLLSYLLQNLLFFDFFGKEALKITFGPAFWIPPLAFSLSCVCSLLLAIHLMKMNAARKKST